MPSSRPWVGRDAELSRIVETMGRSHAAGMLITGSAGIGKTRLMVEALARMPARKYAVHRVSATRAAATVPLAAVSHLLPDGVEGEQRNPYLLRSTAAGLVLRARPRRVIVAVDDAHLLDAASAALVHHLTTVSTVFVLATVRDDESAHDAIEVLRKDNLADHLPLGPLSDANIGAALLQRLDGQVAESVIRGLADLSEGNPLLMTELMNAALADGRLTRHFGVWRLREPWLDGTALPELIAARLSRLDSEVYAAAELVALGEPLGAAEVEILVPAQALVAAEREGLFIASRSERRQLVRLVHPLYGEALRAAITPLRARVVYRQLSQALAATGTRRRGDALRLAIWQLHSGHADDPGLLLRASREDGALFDRNMAERLARAAEQAGGGLPARLVRAEALRWQGHGDQAETLLAAMSTEPAGERQRCHVAAVRASNLYYGLNRPAEGTDLLARTRAHARGQSEAVQRELRGTQEELDALQAEFWFNTGRVGDAATLAEDVLERPGCPPSVYASAASVAGIARSFSGQPERAVAITTRALERHLPADEPRTFAVAELLLLCQALAHIYAGRHADAARLATMHYDDTIERHADALQGQWALVLGQLALSRGQVVTAARLHQEAAALIERHSPSLGRYGVAYALGFLAEASALNGSIAAVDAALARVDDTLPEGVFLCNRERGRVWAAAAQGEISTARGLALASADALAATQAHMHEAMACHDIVRLGAAGNIVARLDNLTSIVESRLCTIYAKHATAMATSDGGTLDEVSAEFDTVGSSLLAAEAAAQASEALRRHGKTVDALAAAQRSRELSSRCEGAHTPALVLAGDPLPLTPREREIAKLAARGLSDRDIAGRLVISERTVHNHLHRTYLKLDISGRQQLRSILP